MRVEAHGLAAELPRGWEARIYGRPRLAPATAVAPLAPRGEALGRGALATLHAASFPLRGDEGAFGGAATSRMPAGGAFLALVEYQPDSALVPGAGLFASRTVPRALAPADFRAEALMVARRGQAGVQRFFTAGERPFCLYAVAGLAAGAIPALDRINGILRSLVIA